MLRGNQISTGMAQPRPLSNPPIVEAVIDVRASIPGTPEDFKTLARELTNEFPHVEIKQQFEGKLEFKNDTPIASITTPPSFAAIRIANEDKSIFVHLEPEGFALINAKDYIGGDYFISEAVKRWEWLVERTTPKSVASVAMNYVNRLEIPLNKSEHIEKYFVFPPKLPEGAPQLISEYLSRVVSRDANRNATATIIQQLKPHTTWNKPFPFRIVVETRKALSPSSVDSTILRKNLDSLRELKNEIFFALLTEETVRIYE